MLSKTMSASQLRKFRSDIAKLKASGLVRAKVDARSQKPTRHMREQINKYSDVLNGKAKAVHVPKASIAKKFDGYRSKGKTVVVPVDKGERVRYNEKSGQIRGYRKRNGQTVTKIFAQAGQDHPTGKNVRYSIPLGRPGERWTFDSWDEIKKFFAEYEKTNRYPNWPKYVESEIVGKP